MYMIMSFVLWISKDEEYACLQVYDLWYLMSLMSCSLRDVITLHLEYGFLLGKVIQNIIKQCAFVHVGPENIIMGCPDLL